MKKKYLEREFFKKDIFLMISVIAVTVFQNLAIMNIFYLPIGIGSDFFLQLI